ncbi:hypothetical protein [Gelidibacter gilvus]|uniref:Lipocalin-like domain-containing protein n=1 Tax=Gelidibacter gilvus TaxID=59602 RepID=A0A4Q0XCD6_9FLAO|nr:hypothetical protein [Gelidibacter gilvus]RXJ44404.1 hypothetical protein ESZ48_17905 [Gelidibacter gilvus]
MKLPLFFLLLVTLSACNEGKSSDTVTEQEAQQDLALKLNGTWEMVGYYNYVNNKITDSFQPNLGYRQVKMYTDQKVMWSKNVPSDSSEWFGYGSYKQDNDELTETLEYGSEMMRRIIEEKHEFKYELVLEKNRFSQIEVDDEGNRLYSENYKRIE